MWFFCAILTVLAWGGADLFYKKGACPNERYSHLKTTVMVGLVMGIHAVFYMLFGGHSFDPINLLRYLPVSFFYIASMALGYFGLRYLELSISSPVQNASGAVTAILVCLFFRQSLSFWEIFGVVLVCAGVFLLAASEKRGAALPPDATREARYGALAILFPILYCLLDAMGTFLDAIWLSEGEAEARFVWLQDVLANFSVMDEDEALLAYEFTFLLCAALLYLYLRFVKKERMNFLQEPVRGTAAILETAGQFFYVYAMSGRAVIAAPVIASYSIVSVLLSRLFLREKLRRGQYVVIAVVMLGIAILGLFDA